MFRRYLILVAIVSLCHFVHPNSLPNLQCSTAATNRHVLEVNVRSDRNASGEWITKLEGRKEMDSRTDNLAMDFRHQVIECGEKQSFHFTAVFGEKPTVDQDKLRFHPKCGKFVAITNNGRTLEKLSAEERFNGVAYSNRHLRLNEPFEVIIEKKEGGKFNYFIGIGVTTTSPDHGEIISHINSLKSGTWALYHNQLYNNGNNLLSNRKTHLDQLKVGDRVGVKRTDTGTLLLLINGKEEAVASNIPEPVYGIFECYGDVSRVTLSS